MNSIRIPPLALGIFAAMLMLIWVLIRLLAEPPKAYVDPSDYTQQFTVVGGDAVTKTFKLANLGGGILNYSIAVSDVTNSFTAKVAPSDGCTVTSIQPQKSCQIEVTFTTLESTPPHVEAYLDIKSNSSDTNQIQIKLIGDKSKWTIVKYPGSDRDSLYGIHFTDRDNGTAVGYRDQGENGGQQGLILRTTDGGATWTAQLFPELLRFVDVLYTNSVNGWAVGTKSPNAKGIIYHSDNYGMTWSKIYETEESLYAATAKDVNNLWFVGDYGIILHLGNANGIRIWEKQLCKEPNVPSQPGSYWEPSRFWNIFIRSSDGWIVSDGNQGVVCRSEDLGPIWKWVDTKVMGMLWDVYFTDSKRGWAVGESGAIALTTDGGITWGEPQKKDFLADRLTSVFMKSAAKGWVAGYGVVATTEDQGQSWADEPTYLSNFYIQRLHFASSTRRLWAVGEFGIKTEKRGAIILKRNVDE